MTRIILALLIFISPYLASAEVWKYTDASGKTFFVDSKDKIPEPYREKSSSDLPALSKGGKPKYDGGSVSAATAEGSKVEIFVTSWCQYCKALEAHLISKKVSFKKYDIEQSGEGVKKYKKFGLKGVPVARVGSKILSGFDKSAVDNALAQL